MGFVRLILVGVFTGIYVRKLSYKVNQKKEKLYSIKKIVSMLKNLNCKFFAQSLFEKI